jgi:hypothetical protein
LRVLRAGRLRILRAGRLRILRAGRLRVLRAGRLRILRRGRWWVLRPRPGMLLPGRGRWALACSECPGVIVVPGPHGWARRSGARRWISRSRRAAGRRPHVLVVVALGHG